TLRSFDHEAAEPWMRAISDLVRVGVVKVMQVGALDAGSMEWLIAQLSGRLSDEQCKAIREKAGGNPFFCEELVRYYYRRRGWQADEYEMELPISLTAVLDQHLAQVGERCRRLLTKAAVLGGDFTFPLIAAMEGVESPDEEMELVDA